MGFFLLSGIKLVKMHSDGNFIHLGFQYILITNLLHHLKNRHQLTGFYTHILDRF